MPRFFSFWLRSLCGMAVAHDYTGDALAYAVGYRMPLLIALDVLLLVVLLSIGQPVPGGYPLRGYRWFFLTAAVICTGIQAFVHFGLDLRPPANIVPCVLSPALTVLVAGAFFLIFNQQEQHTLATAKSRRSSPEPGLPLSA